MYNTLVIMTQYYEVQITEKYTEVINIMFMYFTRIVMEMEP